MFYNTRLSRPITTEWTGLVCVCVSLEMKKCLCSTPVAWSHSTSASILQCACHIYPNTKHTHTPASVSKTTEPHMEKPTVKYSKECVESNAGPLSCGRHKWCFVWVEESGIQPRPLFDVLPLVSPSLPNFHISPVKKATLSLKMFCRKCSILTSFSDFVYNVWTVQYAVSITRCFLAWSETSGSTRWGLACELLFVASGCFQSERGHCHRLKVLIYQHWVEATM